MADTKIEWAKKALKEAHRIKTREGYTLIRFPEHPHAKPNGYVYEHRLIMEVEIGRFLNRDEHVHHKNENKSDNNIENLVLKDKHQHHKDHFANLSPEIKDKWIIELRKSAAKRRKPRALIVCGCGCGGKFLSPDKKGRRKSFIQGHNQRGKHWRWNHG